MTDELKKQMEQHLSIVAKVMPKLWWQLYEGCVSEGFSREQAIELLKAYVASLKMVN